MNGASPLGRRRLVGAGALFVIALLGWWTQREQESPLLLPELSGERVPDYYLEGFTVTTMDEAGRPAHRLSGRSLRHYDDDDSAELEAPRLVVLDAGTPEWRLEAPRARLLEGGERLLLEGEVVLTRRAPPGGEALHLTTRDLWFFPHRDLAESDAEVVIRRGASTLSGQGLRLDLAAGRMTLLSQVRGRHVF